MEFLFLGVALGVLLVPGIFFAVVALRGDLQLVFFVPLLTDIIAVTTLTSTPRCLEI